MDLINITVSNILNIEQVLAIIYIYICLHNSREYIFSTTIITYKLHLLSDFNLNKSLTISDFLCVLGFVTYNIVMVILCLQFLILYYEFIFKILRF